jgi:hypothetical protein
MNAAAFLSKLQKVRRSGHEWTAQCPAHDDRRASLSIAEADDARILINCHAGCSAESTLTVANSIFWTEAGLMCSRREIARDWRVAKSYVDKCVTLRGCPTSSLQEARKWREENTYRRAPTNQKSLARVLAEEGDINSPEDGILIPLATAKAIAFRGYDFILDLVDHLPKNTAAQCNPGNPQIAYAVLKSECTYILCNACEAYTAWSKVGPHITTVANAE